MSNCEQSDCSVSEKPSLLNIELPVLNNNTELNERKEAIQTSAKLTLQDYIGACMVRWGIKRGKYSIEPGLYKIGTPDENSNVIVTSNYKLTFDMVRKELDGLNLWILVLDTKGINVWCAAGKGTFGTRELIYRIAKTNLTEVVKHRKIIVPQLGAPGVEAHLVEKFSEFKVKYGPVYAKDIKSFLNNNMKATDEMRNIKFTFRERLALVPMELVPAMKLVPVMIFLAFLFNFLESGEINKNIFHEMVAYPGIILFGSVIFQLILPIIPTKSFVVSGWLLGIIWVLILMLIFPLKLSEILVFLLMLPPVIAYLTVNFTGATTFTSLSGVNKELKYALPLIIGSVSIGILTNIFSLIFK